MHGKKIRQLSLNAILAAMCAVLGYLALDLGNIKISFESVPILIAAMLFGAVNAAAVGAVGALIYQFLRYGLSVTTALWVLPYIVGGIIAGIYARRRGFTLTQKQCIFITVLAELAVTVLNTGAIAADAVIFGYYTPALITGALLLRLVLCIVKALVYAFLLPPLLSRLKKVLERP